jgi:hypothetical protein
MEKFVQKAPTRALESRFVKADRDFLFARLQLFDQTQITHPSSSSSMLFHPSITKLGRILLRVQLSIQPIKSLGALTSSGKAS